MNGRVAVWHEGCAKSGTVRIDVKRPNTPIQIICGALAASALLLTASCELTPSGAAKSKAKQNNPLQLDRIYHTAGSILPHRIHVADALTGLPLSPTVEIRSIQTLIDNQVSSLNPVLQAATWPTTATLPDGSAGNHYIAIEFDGDMDPLSVIDPSPSASFASFLTGSISLVAVDPQTGLTSQVVGRPFVNGQTAGAGGVMETWVALDGSGRPVASVLPDSTIPGFGFPGTETLPTIPMFAGASDLVALSTLVFVADTDNDLSTHETFPAGQSIRVQVGLGVKSSGGRYNLDEAVAATTVGADAITPEVMYGESFEDGTANPLILDSTSVPLNGQIAVVPDTTILVEFTEPVQPHTLGPFSDGGLPGISTAVQVEFGPVGFLTQVPFTVLPAGPYNLARFEIFPAFAFPGSDPQGNGGAAVTVTVQAGIIRDLLEDDPGTTELEENVNQVMVAVNFSVGPGPGTVNAPVVPDAIYIGRSGAVKGLSIIDLNGFGQGTGDLSTSNWPNNPNLLWQGNALLPILSTGTSTLDAGGAGVFSLTRDSNLQDIVLGAPLLGSVVDIQVGGALDILINNSPSACTSQGGNFCVQEGMHATYGNSVGIRPHPNPPRIVFPPSCVVPFIPVQEPTLTGVAQNLLGPGIPFNCNAQGLPSTPTGLLAPSDAMQFYGPTSPPPATIAGCVAQYQLRQQIGQFVYILDGDAHEVVVVNSNRATIIERLPLPGTTHAKDCLAISPDLSLLAISNEGADTVSVVDIDPASSTFHSFIKEISVGNQPRGVAWQPENEDFLVANFGSNSVSVIAADQLAVRKTVTSGISGPILMSVSTRATWVGGNGLYFGYVVNSSGTVTVFESGPSEGANAIGFDDMIGQLVATFPNPQAIIPVTSNIVTGFWIAHQDSLGNGRVSRVALISDPGPQPLEIPAGFFAAPGFRDKEWGVTAYVDSSELSSDQPVDIALDNLVNLGALGGLSSGYNDIPAAQHSGKTLYRIIQGAPVPVGAPEYLFVAHPSAGIVDVIKMTGLVRTDVDPCTPGTQSIVAPGVSVVADYWRQ